MISRLSALLQKEFTLTFRNVHQVVVVLLYLLGSVFVTYKALNSIDPRVWNALFWILFLFVSISATNISFQSESGRGNLFLYNLYNPYELIVSKIMFNFLLLAIISGLLVMVLSVFFPVSFLRPVELLYVLFLASFGVSCSFSLISCMATMEHANMSLMSIMALPTVLPIFLTGLKLSAHAMGIISDTDIGTDYLILMAIDLIILGIVLLLFPYLWKS